MLLKNLKIYFSPLYTEQIIEILGFKHLENFLLFIKIPLLFNI